VDAWLELGTVLQQEGDVAGAIEALRRTVALDSANAGAWNSLGLLLRRKGDAEGARAAFAAAAELRQAEAREKEKAIREGAARLSK